jgi:hypothetical protein
MAKQSQSLKDDVQVVNQILIEAKVVKQTNVNQIRLFLNGNAKSHLHDKFASLYPKLWGQYPTITQREIEDVLNVMPESINQRYRSFENLQGAKTFTEKDLEALADWDVIPKELKQIKPHKSLLINGHMVHFGSQPELNTYLCLKENRLIQSFRGQHLMIHYASYLSEDKKYYPDFVFLTPDGYIAIVESKPIQLMSYFIVEAKYHFLKRYCEAHGFIYAMMDENLVTIEQVRQEPLPTQVTDYLDHLLDTARIFNDGAMQMVYQRFGDQNHKDLDLIASKHWIQRELVNKSQYGFLIKKQRKINYDVLDRLTNRTPNIKEKVKGGDEHE